jgi:hypothetical protein
MSNLQTATTLCMEAEIVDLGQNSISDTPLRRNYLFTDSSLALFEIAPGALLRK